MLPIYRGEKFGGWKPSEGITASDESRNPPRQRQKKTRSRIVSESFSFLPRGKQKNTVTLTGADSHYECFGEPQIHHTEKHMGRTQGSLATYVGEQGKKKGHVAMDHVLIRQMDISEFHLINVLYTNDSGKSIVFKSNTFQSFLTCFEIIQTIDGEPLQQKS